MNDVSALVSTVMFVVAGVLLVAVVAGLWRAARGPTTRDRLTAFVLLGTTGAALFAVLGSATETAALRDAALILVALATVVTVVLARPGQQPSERSEPEQ
ncbi:monovalent cation/H+ antiporter complex subunit F [Nocardioides massiliensis]|uniref:Multisubunit Na+/H+ antiporter MnhF subunit n=1 Tax=Nocardioides massiliensis TaxID=1325935 RepID=A0ABT9NQH8_9ACTN|nr:monovalent cation/H+ antiporter complex subunit F [Nocardioides massiliensis]MDP9822685.1 multisubunit Na+/H+ antiporter MnhF subunit [Nocardioides massiliensis]